MAAAASITLPLAGFGTGLSRFFENAPLGVAQCDGEGTILGINPRMTEMLGVRVGGEPSRFPDFLAAEDRELNVGIFGRLWSGEQCSVQREGLLTCLDGSGKWLRWIAWGVRGNATNQNCVLLLAEDMTEAHRREQSTLQSERLQELGRMAGSIAHDFNNLLTGVLLYCDLIVNELGHVSPVKEERSAVLPGAGELEADFESSRERLRNYTGEIRSASVQATGIVQQLLTVTRPRTLHVQSLCLNLVVEGMRNLLQRLLGENIELVVHLEPRLGLIKMDPAQAQQLLLNLVLNARDALAAGGRIEVSTENCSVQIFRDQAECKIPCSHEPGKKNNLANVPCVLFVVTDNGSGMSEETRQQVFRPYFTTKEEGNGNGLGLATVHSIVAGRGGLVQVESATDQGTRVLVLLPSTGGPQTSPGPC